MPSARIHEAIVKELNKEKNYDELLLRVGTVAPDSWRNVDENSGIKDKYLSHFWDFRIKDGQANDYTEFYLKYYKELEKPFYFGYLVHLIVDQYWKTHIDPKYRIEENGIKGYRLKDGSFHDDKEWWGYFDSLKMQREIARIYHLEKFPIDKEEYENLKCHIDELNISGLFGDKGTLNYINEETSPKSEKEESLIYDINEVIKDIDNTVAFVKRELKRLKTIKEENDLKIKIAIDIDDTLLETKELEDYYWKEFLMEHKEVNPNKKYKWGDKELALFWSIYREKMAFGKVKEGAQISIQQLLEKGYQVDLLSARPLEKYASLKKQLVEYFESQNIQYNYLNLGFYSKKDFLKEHNYHILIDNEIRHMIEAESVGVTPILFDDNKDYKGYQTNNWLRIPSIVEQIVESIK